MINRNVTLPQANDLSLIIETIDGISESGWNKDDWVFQMGYRERQFGYYADAAVWLGLLDVNRNGRTKEYISNPSTHTFLKASDRFSYIKSILFSEPLFVHITTFPKEDRVQQGILFLESNESVYGIYPSLAVKKRRTQCFCSWANQLNL